MRAGIIVDRLIDPCLLPDSFTGEDIFGKFCGTYIININYAENVQVPKSEYWFSPWKHSTYLTKPWQFLSDTFYLCLVGKFILFCILADFTRDKLLKHGYYMENSQKVFNLPQNFLTLIWFKEKKNFPKSILFPWRETFLIYRNQFQPSHRYKCDSCMPEVHIIAYVRHFL